tara:strand:- start:1580 stop:1804 length:225 start_codon:yes stop_codon:yes gene_type:complete
MMMGLQLLRCLGCVLVVAKRPPYKKIPHDYARLGGVGVECEKKWADHVSPEQSAHNVIAPLDFRALLSSVCYVV